MLMIWLFFQIIYYHALSLRFLLTIAIDTGDILHDCTDILHISLPHKSNYIIQALWHFMTKAVEYLNNCGQKERLQNPANCFFCMK